MCAQITYGRQLRKLYEAREAGRIAWEKVVFGKSLLPAAFRVTVGRDGYWQWCATPPGGDRVHDRFETAEALKDAEATLSAQDASTS